MAAGEGLEPSVFGSKARRVASYTIPQLVDLSSVPSGGYGWIRTTILALMRRLLFPVELHSHVILVTKVGARGETRTHEYRICNPAP